jgi:RimJ/RimL family protein N-acetyltransferase
MTAAPRIETERLVLRAPRFEDFPPVAAFFAREASRFVGGPLEERPVWYWFSSGIGDWDLLGFGSWAIEARATGALAGLVWLNHPPGFPEREMGWLLLPGFEGRGFATEAARAARGYAYGSLGWPTAVSYVDAENHRSCALARRLGAREDPAAPRPGPDGLVFRHPSPEALS